METTLTAEAGTLGDIRMANDQQRTGTTDVKGLQEALEKIIPRSLDDIVRVNRDRFQIGLANVDELSARAATIVPGRTKDIIDSWRIIAFRSLNPEADFGGAGNSLLSVLGRAVGMGCPLVTSQVTQIDIRNGLVRTRNSVYRLGSGGVGEPPLDDLIHLCAAICGWGFGSMIGAPEFFY
jgi:hypothetical protein